MLVRTTRPACSPISPSRQRISTTGAMRHNPLHTVLPLRGIDEGRCRTVEPLHDTHREFHPDGIPGSPDPRQLVPATAKVSGKLSPTQLPIASPCIEGRGQCFEIP